MMGFAKKLGAAGELVAAEGLAGPDQARLVRAGQDGKPITDGVFPETKHERLLRDLAPQVLGAVIRRFRDFSASEDAVQEALIAAATQWPREGLPDKPRAWLYQVASLRIADHVRAETARRRREAIVVSLVPPELQIDLAADDDNRHLQGTSRRACSRTASRAPRASKSIQMALPRGFPISSGEVG